MSFFAIFLYFLISSMSYLSHLESPSIKPVPYLRNSVAVQLTLLQTPMQQAHSPLRPMTYTLLVSHCCHSLSLEGQVHPPASCSIIFYIPCCPYIFCERDTSQSEMDINWESYVWIDIIWASWAPLPRHPLGLSWKFVPDLCWGSKTPAQQNKHQAMMLEDRGVRLSVSGESENHSLQCSPLKERVETGPPIFPAETVL